MTARDAASTERQLGERVSTQVVAHAELPRVVFARTQHRAALSDRAARHAPCRYLRETGRDKLRYEPLLVVGRAELTLDAAAPTEQVVGRVDTATVKRIDRYLN